MDNEIDGERLDDQLVAESAQDETLVSAESDETATPKRFDLNYGYCSKHQRRYWGSCPACNS